MNITLPFTSLYFVKGKKVYCRKCKNHVYNTTQQIKTEFRANAKWFKPAKDFIFKPKAKTKIACPFCQPGYFLYETNRSKELTKKQLKQFIINVYQDNFEKVKKMKEFGII